MSRVALYGRVSLDRSNGDVGRSVTEQLDDLRAIATREGWTVVREFTDNDRSASRYARRSRPGFIELVEFIESGGCDLVAVWESSRLTRDLEVHLRMQRLCRERGVRWAVQNRVIDPDDIDDEFQSNINAVVDAHSSNQTAKRVQRAVRANAVAGRPHGRHVYGYKRVYDPVSRGLLEVAIDEDQAAVLREVADRFLSGASFYALAQDLEARGVPAPAGTRWHPTNLARLMRNPTYIGKRTHNGEVVGDADWPAIFDEHTWWQLQARLADPARKSRREGSVRHLLTELATCGVCGGRIQSQKARGPYRTLTCINRFCVARKESDVDDFVTQVIAARLSQPDVLDLLVSDHSDDDTKQAVAEAQAKRARLQTFYDAAATGEITAAALGRIEATLLAEIKAAEDRARRAALPSAVRDLAGVDVAAVWDDLPITTRREVIRTLAEIRILPTGRGTRHFDPDSVSITWRTT
jgi:site-specific DNA recombinase